MKVLILVISVLISQLSFCQNFDLNKKEIKRIIEDQQQNLDTIHQLLLVVNDNDSSHKAVLIAMEKRNHRWKLKFKPMEASIGKNGFALPGQKQEGDGKSPTGIFILGRLFSYENKVNTKLLFTQTTEDDKWIDDPDHADYNKYVKGITTAKSFEHLRLAGIYYKYCMVIEYNTNPILKGKGECHILSSGR